MALTDERIRVIAAVPGNVNDSKMLFVKDQIRSLVRHGVNVHEFYLSSRTNILVIAKESYRLYKEIGRFRPHIIHAHFGTLTSFLCAVISLICGVPLMITFHGSDLNDVSNVEGHLRNMVQKIMSNLAALRASRIICVSERLLHRLWWRRGGALVIPNGVDADLFYPLDWNDARAQLGWDLSGHVILFCQSNFSRLKRVDIALSTLDRLKSHVQTARLQILNDVEHNVVPLYLSAADCLLVCSDSEGSPTIVKEAMACNLPIVSTDVGDVAERIRGLYQCSIVEREPNALARALADTIEAGERSNGRTRIMEEGLTDSVVAAKILSVYRDLIQQNG